MGPASSPKDVLRQLFIEGVDICRVNFSHGAYDEHLKVVNTIRELNAEMGLNVAILGDLQGPKLRVGEMENNGVPMPEGHEFIFTDQKCVGNAQRVYMSYPNFAHDVNSDEYILLDDGKLKMQVISTDGKSEVKVRVINGGILSSKKGVNLPDTKISLPSLTPKDIADAEFALEHDFDWIALSFVRSVNDIIDLRNIIRKSHKKAGIVAKIEKPEALLELNEIIDATNAVMVARGDLGVEVPFDKVPLIQKDIVKRCVNMGKPVIIATQMMESMITNFSPTRAEATDVANAVIDGADALMLSGETSVGKYPVQVIQSMQSIINNVEHSAVEYYKNNPPLEFTPTFFPDSVCNNAAQLAKNANANAVVVFTNSGYTATRVSSHRPKAPIYAFTPNSSLLSRLSLLWGVRAFTISSDLSFDEAVEYTISDLKKRGLLRDNEIIVHVGSSPLKGKGQTNTLRLSYS